MALNRVVGVRVAALLVQFFLIAGVVLVIVAAILSGGSEDESSRLVEVAMPWLGAAFATAGEAYYFLRLVRHFGDVAVAGEGCRRSAGSFLEQTEPEKAPESAVRSPATRDER